MLDILPFTGEHCYLSTMILAANMQCIADFTFSHQPHPTLCVVNLRGLGFRIAVTLRIAVALAPSAFIMFMVSAAGACILQNNFLPLTCHNQTDEAADASLQVWLSASGADKPTGSSALGVLLHGFFSIDYRKDFAKKYR